MCVEKGIKEQLYYSYSCLQYLPIELSHCDRFWVEDIGPDRLIEGVGSLVPCVMEGLQGVCKDGVDGGLTSTSWADQHHTVTN